MARPEERCRALRQFPSYGKRHGRGKNSAGEIQLLLWHQGMPDAARSAEPASLTHGASLSTARPHAVPARACLGPAIPRGPSSGPSYAAWRRTCRGRTCS